MPNTQNVPIKKTATVRVTHTHNFDDPDHPDASPGVCRCGTAEADADGPVRVTEVSSGE
jgi:hypothetical protein